MPYPHSEVQQLSQELIQWNSRIHTRFMHSKNHCSITIKCFTNQTWMSTIEQTQWQISTIDHLRPNSNLLYHWPSTTLTSSIPKQHNTLSQTATFMHKLLRNNKTLTTIWTISSRPNSSEIALSLKASSSSASTKPIRAATHSKSLSKYPPTSTLKTRHSSCRWSESRTSRMLSIAREAWYLQRAVMVWRSI